jgi:two-component system cell cycle sensor histidine kinase/response regulator CckA
MVPAPGPLSQNRQSRLSPRFQRESRTGSCRSGATVQIISGRTEPDSQLNLVCCCNPNPNVSITNKEYRRIVEAVPEGIWVVDPQGRTIFSNRRMAEILAICFESMLEQSCFDYVFPDELADAQRHFARTLAGDRRPFDFRLRRADGSPVWVSISCMPVYDDTDVQIGLLGLFSDISERKRAEQAISEGQRRLRIAKDAARLGIYEYDVPTGTILWDARVRELWGVGLEVPITIDTFFSGLHPEDRARTQAILERSLDSAGTGEYYAEYRVISQADGRERWVAASGQVLFENGRPMRMIGTGQDISERKRAEAALRDSEERLKRAERIAHVGNWSVDLKTKKVSWSDEVFQIFGRSKEYQPGYAEFVESTVPEDRGKMAQWESECIARNRGAQIEHRIIRPDGDVRTVSCTCEVQLDEEASVVRLFGTCQDITEIRRVQEESFARHKLESVGTLAGGIAHDFNNLLGGVLGQAELALMQLETGGSPEEELKAIREVALRGSEIVRQLMIYAGKESETIGQVDLSQTVSEMIELLRVSVSKHAVLITDLGQGLPALQANAAQIRRIVMNLVTNASQAIGNQDGVIRVSTGHLTAVQSAAFATGSAEQDYLELEVSDTGCGMSPEVQSKVFDPFFTTRSAGHGLGLAVVQGIVRNLGGTIHLASELGKGTTFRILVPCAPAAAEQTMSPLSSAKETTRGLLRATILIVEDEDVLRQSVAKMLRGIGSEVFEAANGSDAIDLLRSRGGQMDAILLDLTIPGASSQEVLAEATQGWPGLKVILCSAYSQEMAAANMRAPIVRGFIRKPFPLGDVVQMLRTVLSS